MPMAQFGSRLCIWAVQSRLPEANLPGPNHWTTVTCGKRLCTPGAHNKVAGISTSQVGLRHLIAVCAKFVQAGERVAAPHPHGAVFPAGRQRALPRKRPY